MTETSGDNLVDSEACLTRHLNVATKAEIEKTFVRAYNKASRQEGTFSDGLEGGRAKLWAGHHTAGGCWGLTQC